MVNTALAKLAAPRSVAEELTDTRAAADVLLKCQSRLERIEREPGYDAARTFTTLLGELAAVPLGRACAKERQRLQASVPVPIHKLVGFQRVRLAPGEQRRLHFKLTPEMMALVNEAGEAVLEAGRFRLAVGGCSPGGRGESLGAPRMASTIFEVI